MKKIVKELAEKAEKYADDNFKGEPTYSEAYDSKFAELIVAECLYLCESTAAGQDAEAIQEATQQHFGVQL